MNTRITLAAIALLAAGSTLAGPPAGPGPGHGAPDMDRMATLLDLDEGQKVAVKQVLDEQFQQRKAEWEKARESQTRPSRDAMRAQREKMEKETIEKLRPILSDVQLTKFQALMAPPAHMHPDQRGPNQKDQGQSAQ